MINLTDRPYLFVDETLPEHHDGTELRLHEPRREDVSIVMDAPWEGPTSAYFTIVDADDRFLMYYRGTASYSDFEEQLTCVAESTDGIEWKRRLAWKHAVVGTKANNVIWANEKDISHNFGPFRDENPDAPEDARFKAFGGLPNSGGLYVLASADGIEWRLLRDEPAMTEGHFDSLNQGFFDTELGKYVCYFREFKDGVRAIRRSVSEDLFTWSEPEWLDFGPGDGAPNADPKLEQFYTNAIRQYDRDPGLYLGFPKRFVREHTLIPDWPGGTGLSDSVLIASRDGIHFPRRFREAFIRPGLDQMNWNERNLMMAPGMIRTSPTEYSLYWSEHYRRHDNRLQRGTIRVDGFASLHAGFPGGEMLTKPVKLGGEAIVLNMATSAAGSIRVEVQDENGKVIPGYGLDECDELYGDDIERVVTWNGNPEPASISGDTVRLRIALADADVFSVACV